MGFFKWLTTNSCSGSCWPGCCDRCDLEAAGYSTFGKSDDECKAMAQRARREDARVFLEGDQHNGGNPRESVVMGWEEEA